jgi:4-amino-4-deoxy-L-arabinose transferase-like glycosyltransferase
MPDFLRSRFALYVLAAGFAVLSLLVLDVRTLIQPDEGRYAEMAREMLLSGDWITTRLNGIKYFEKPPLHTWMSAIAFAVFGIGEWQARLWNGLCGVLTVFLVGYTGHRVFGGRAGYYAALVLASTLYWSATSQFNSLDMAVAATMALSLCALLLAQRDDADAAQRRRWMLVCWAGMALSLLTKGLIGIVLPGGVLLVYALTSGDRAIWRRLHPLGGLAVFLILSLPWFLLVAARNPEQPHFFFIHEHWDRFLLKTHRREGPWYYFLVLMLPASLPWLPLLPGSLAQARQRAAGRFQPLRLLLVWLVFILAFFSYSSSKLPGYVVPVFPAIALLTGVYLERAGRTAALLVAALLALIGAAGLAAAPFVGKLGHNPIDVALFESTRMLLAAGCLAALLAGGAAIRAEWRGRRDAMVLAVALGAWLLAQCTLAAHEPFGRQRSGADLALSIRAELSDATPVYSVGTYRQSMTFYMRHTVIPVHYTDELGFGLLQEPERGIATLEEFQARWERAVTRGERQYAIVSANAYRTLVERGLPMTLRATGDDMVLIATLPVS